MEARQLARAVPVFRRAWGCVAMNSVFRKVRQVAVVTRDTRGSAKRFSDILGVGPWEFYDFSPTCCKHMTVDGVPTDYAMALAICNIGTIQFEFCEPLDNRSLYARYLIEKGEGLQHIAYELDRGFDEAVLYFEARGISISQSGNWHGCCNFNYLDSFKQLKHTAEFHNQDLNEIAKYSNYGEYPAPSLNFRGEPLLTDIVGVGIVVNDLEATVSNYEEGFGVGPWEVSDYNKRTVADMKVHGEASDYSYRVATAIIGNTEVELVQPLDRNSIFWEYSRLSAVGEGFHSLEYKVSDYDKLKATLRDVGVPIAQHGVRNGEKTVYFNSRNLLQHLIKVKG